MAGELTDQCLWNLNTSVSCSDASVAVQLLEAPGPDLAYAASWCSRIPQLLHNMMQPDATGRSDHSSCW